MSGPAEVKFRGVLLLGQEGHAIKTCCELFGVSCSGFYDWKRRPLSNRVLKDQELLVEVKNIFNINKERYGSPLIQRALAKQGKAVGENKVARLMRKEGLYAKGKKAFRAKTTINNPSDKKSERVYKIEEQKITKENEVWVSDLTYIRTKEGFCYLTIVMDLWNREIKGKNIANNMLAENTKDALLKAVKSSSGKLDKTIFHSDQGVQYCSFEFREKLELLSMTQSMSRKGNCYDNAFAESFFHSLKTELGHKVFENFKEAKKEINEYINWYNNERLHSSLGYLSPKDYVRENNPIAA